MGEKSWDLPLGEGWPGDAAVGKVGGEGFVKVEKDGVKTELEEVLVNPQGQVFNYNANAVIV